MKDKFRRAQINGARTADPATPSSTGDQLFLADRLTDRIMDDHAMRVGVSTSVRAI
ncbi:hypothetical protein ABIE58_003367 [Roseovarius sp. MBR-78]|jgi:hypothetical protein|uniref:hypothetical protein n=1 Tax=Roseovarius sp. MBR-78 TaxID=3156460 RepID=UPI00339AFB04